MLTFRNHHNTYVIPTANTPCDMATPTQDVFADVLQDWLSFIRSGFDYTAFTDALHQHLVQHCAFNPYLSRSQFWHYYFAADFDRLQRFLGQFAGTYQAAETGDTAWLANCALNYALCEGLAKVFPIIKRTLAELSLKLYQTQKWQLLSEKAEAFNADPQRLIDWSHAYDKHVPFAEQSLCFQVDDAVRAFLKSALAEHFSSAQQLSLFQTNHACPNVETNKATLWTLSALSNPSISLFAVCHQEQVAEPTPLLEPDEAEANRSQRMARLAESRPLISFDHHLAYRKEVFDDQQAQTYQLAS